MSPALPAGGKGPSESGQPTPVSDPCPNASLLAEPTDEHGKAGLCREAVATVRSSRSLFEVS